MDTELAEILLKECVSRAAANVGEERRFFQALVNTLEDALKKIDPEIVFAVRMLMLKYNLGRADMCRIMVELDKPEGDSRAKV
jgi:hypothetical protein